MIIPGAQQGQRTADAGLTPRSGVHFHTGSDAANETIDILLTQRSNILVTDSTFWLKCTLPSVAEAGGMIFLFYLVTHGGQDVTITDSGDDADFNDVTMDAGNDAFMLISDGVHWFAISCNATT